MSSTRQLTVAALGTFLSLVAFTVPVATLNPIAATLGSGTSGRTWILSSMSIGLGAFLLTVIFNIVLLLGFPVQLQFIVKGLIIILAMAIYRMGGGTAG